ncbi:hypothetical protein LUZ63_017954 [Rhynchospora breviuscula]|uniref:PCI domain-containing protein n=1 Tax=Rhynchospora breviuscula TaxID=2022672 RepID=A0A9Q0HH86_9POAL|nr:hypothetical protein LUZ63_017954 [Rhynchospora breviuscula]
MSQGGEPLAGINPNPSENQVTYVGQTHAASNPYLTPPGPQVWHPPPQPAPTSWSYRPENLSTQNGYPSNYYYDPQRDASVPSHTQSGPSPTPNAQLQGYSTPYAASYQSSVVPHNNSADYATSFYSNANINSSSLQVAPNQNTGASNQPPFQNSVGHTSSTTMSNSNIYYNASGDHQNTATTAPSYQSGGYYYQQAGQAYAYPSANQGSTTVNPSYQQQYGQPYYYYNHPAGGTSVGTEGTMPGGANAGSHPGVGAAGGYSYPTNQPPPPGTSSWRPDPGTSTLPPVQGVGATGYPAQYPGQFQAYPQKPADQVPASAPTLLLPSNNAIQGNVFFSQTPNMHVSSTNQFQQASQSSQPQPQLQPPPPPYPAQIPDTRQIQGSSQLHPNMVQMPETRQVSKMQIPTNPRIAPGLSTGTVKVDRGSISTGGLAKPAYVNVSVPKNDTKLTSIAEDADKVAIPVSLKAYVERSFARCKTDAQRTANQALMKEVITKASAEGTLFTKNWDLEPLLTLPSSDATNTNSTQESTIFSSLNKEKRKSRWEPVEDTPEKKVELVSNSTNGGPSNIGYSRPEATPKMDGKNWNTMKFVKAQKQSNFSSSGRGSFKKQKTNTFIRKPAGNADSSSDSDKERELTKYYSSAISIANSPEEKKRREHRSKRFDKRKIEGSTPNNSSSILTRKANAMLLAKNYDENSGTDRAVEDIDWDSLTVKGTCQEIEKRYLRLTSAPDPSTVRPEDVLEKALKMVQTSNKNYLYKCDQLKSIRQDLTVQRIQNELTAKVYETHARLAIQYGDLAEYNQCQSQLKRLYAESIKGCANEFSAYHLLHVSIHSNNKRDLLSSMARLSIKSKQDEAVKHALKVRAAVSSGNYLLFFRLYKAAPNLNTCFMDLYVEKMRFEAVKSMSKAYRPTLPVRYVAQVLGFMKNSEEKKSEITDKSGFEDCEQWLKAHGAVLKSDGSGDLQLDGKASMTTLYMPEPENAVSHGDASLAVDDFLTRAP